MFFTAFALCSLELFKLKTEGQTVFRKPHRKVAKHSLILGKLNQVLKLSAQELRF